MGIDPPASSAPVPSNAGLSAAKVPPSPFSWLFVISRVPRRSNAKAGGYLPPPSPKHEVCEESRCCCSGDGVKRLVLKRGRRSSRLRPCNPWLRRATHRSRRRLHSCIQEHVLRSWFFVRRSLQSSCKISSPPSTKHQAPSTSPHRYRVALGPLRGATKGGSVGPGLTRWRRGSVMGRLAL